MFKLIQQTPITLSIALAAIIAFMIPSAAGWLVFNTTGNMLVQLPQLISCHLLHWSFDHLSWDLFMFVLVGMICERRGKLAFATVLLLSAISIPMFVAALVPAVDSYRGLSGIDTALFGFAALLLIDESAKEQNWMSLGIYGFLFVGMLAKIGFELAFGGTVFVSSEAFFPVPVAHIVGAVIGTLIAGFQIIRSGREHHSPPIQSRNVRPRLSRQ